MKARNLLVYLVNMDTKSIRSIESLPVMRISNGVYNLMKKNGELNRQIPVSHYASEIKTRRNEIGCDEKYRYVLSR